MSQIIVTSATSWPTGLINKYTLYWQNIYTYTTCHMHIQAHVFISASIELQLLNIFLEIFYSVFVLLIRVLVTVKVIADMQ